MDNKKWLEIAKAKIDKLPNGSLFELKELFAEVNWKKLSKGERITFGRFFANEVREGRLTKIVPLKRGKNNHSRYEKSGV